MTPSPTPAPPPAWAHLPFFQADWPRIAAHLAGTQWLPGPDRVFAALQAVSPRDVRVVILGQDPYPTPGHADGLAFSVAPQAPLPRSLRNIYAEMRDDLGAAPADGYLGHWAAQGVLLLNTALSVGPGDAGSHARLGWSGLASQVIDAAQRGGPIAFVLWGGHAQGVARGLARPQDLVLASAHPSPLSARRGFFGSRPFSRVNDWLTAQGRPAIDWVGTDRPALFADR
ncbi:uracil-DNA glycosylase [Paracoccus suum]|uniref:Uracil-DNA glycosylase n=1 Tax=Paracoccus suum TaxID=2259340 RepID=A0A344PK87_9RHOB|nr:uracil-DNA glycosylase [Paracoccus suum]AXC49792.1 uracil-DNA glycosylase [Paracoccus suum]